MIKGIKWILILEQFVQDKTRILRGELIVNYLLTYYDDKNNCTFEWFDTEDEMKEYANDPDGRYDVAKVIDMLYIKDYEDLNVPMWKSTKKQG
jgi:hypothetical protein